MLSPWFVFVCYLFIHLCVVYMLFFATPQFPLLSSNVLVSFSIPFLKRVRLKVYWWNTICSTAPFAHLLRPSSPTPFFTPLKAAAHSPLRGALMPSSSSLTMDSLVGDVPAYQAAPTGPLSPSSMSYKILLDDLPSQLHPRSKGSKKKENGSGVSSTTCGSGRDAGDNENIQVAEPIERRISVRATECVFRYKQIVVKKCHRYTQIWLNTQTTLKNAFNPSVGVC